MSGARWKGADQPGQQVLQRLDHALLARDDDPERVASEQLGSDQVEARDHIAEVLFAEPGQLPHRVEHADALQPVVDRAL